VASRGARTKTEKIAKLVSGGSATGKNTIREEEAKGGAGKTGQECIDEWSENRGDLANEK